MFINCCIKFVFAFKIPGDYPGKLLFGTPDDEKKKCLYVFVNFVVLNLIDIS